MIWLFRIQRSVADPEPQIGVGCRAENLLLPQLAGNLTRSIASGTHGEDPAHNCCGFLIHHQLFAVVFILPIAVGCSGAKTFSSFRLGFENSPNLAAGVPNIPFVEEVLLVKNGRNRRKSVIMRVCGDWLSKAPEKMMTRKFPIFDKSILISRENASCVVFSLFSTPFAKRNDYYGSEQT